MPQITELLIKQIDGIAESYALNISEPAHKLMDMRESVLKEMNLILNFDSKTYADKSLCAIDGGSLTQKLSGGDLLVTAATLAEGYYNKAIYPTDESVPAEVYVEMLPHKQSNEVLLSAMRALIELKVWHTAKSDVRIIDGAYLGNASTLLFALIKEDKYVRDTILKFDDFDGNAVLQDALEELLVPKRELGRITIAVPKSDSASHFVEIVFGGKTPESLKLTDRSLSSVLLKPGELFMPRSLESNNPLLERLAKINGEEDFIKNSNSPALLKRILKNKASLLQSLGNKGEDGGVLYTTFFKPRLWSEASAAIKVEFTYFKEYGMTLEEYAQMVVSIVDSDIIDESIVEPWSQYYADRRAKEVSVGADMIKHHLIANASTPYEIAGLTRSYRT